ITGKTPAHDPGVVDVKATRDTQTAVWDGGGYRYTCRIDDDCGPLNAGLRCDELNGVCVPAKGCNDDTNCDDFNNDQDYCYHYGLQCRCVTPEANDAGTSGVCRRRHGICAECTDNAECG